MVDVGEKQESHRVAIAHGRILMRPETLSLIRQGNSKKGDVLGVARIAAISAAKKTSDLIPLCHPLMLSKISVDFDLQDSPAAVICTARVEVTAKTGVEMEALTAVQVGLLTIYDMCKAVDRDMTMTDIQLIEKSGGRSGHYQRTTSSSSL